MTDPADGPASLTDEEIETHRFDSTAAAATDDATDTADDSGDVSDATDTGDDAGDTTDTGDDSGDATDASDTGDDS
ncbi:MAG: hypothetical protein QOE31_3416 [Solirubrobacteraceae bacterium]|jgi:hypothetical protein|nr:hypothetical protein [Solirubrobacteraceae bacterium]